MTSCQRLCSSLHGTFELQYKKKDDDADTMTRFALQGETVDGKPIAVTSIALGKVALQDCQTHCAEMGVVRLALHLCPLGRSTTLGPRPPQECAIDRDATVSAACVHHHTSSVQLHYRFSHLDHVIPSPRGNLVH